MPSDQHDQPTSGVPVTPFGTPADGSPAASAPYLPCLTAYFPFLNVQLTVQVLGRSRWRTLTPMDVYDAWPALAARAGLPDVPGCWHVGRWYPKGDVLLTTLLTGFAFYEVSECERMGDSPDTPDDAEPALECMDTGRAVAQWDPAARAAVPTSSHPAGTGLGLTPIMPYRPRGEGARTASGQSRSLAWRGATSLSALAAFPWTRPLDCSIYLPSFLYENYHRQSEAGQGGLPPFSVPRPKAGTRVIEESVARDPIARAAAQSAGSTLVRVRLRISYAEAAGAFYSTLLPLLEAVAAHCGAETGGPSRLRLLGRLG